MQFHPKALIVTAIMLTLIWLAVAQGFGLLTIALDAALGWGLWQALSATADPGRGTLNGTMNPPPRS
jgi:hypothetical protein